MNIQIITSSYPSNPDDPAATAGLFIRDFALELLRHGHKVIVQPVARKETYQADPGLIIEPIPWDGGDQELASMNIFSPRNWPVFFKFFLRGRKNTINICQKYGINRILCMWVVPSGVFGFWIKNKTKIPYDVWALGSDIWKIKRIPFFGRRLLKTIIKNADRVFADGIGLCKGVETIANAPCAFLPSARKLPPPQENLLPLEPQNAVHLLFVGRYHHNKGPDLLLEAITQLPQETKNTIRLHMFGAGPLKDKLMNMVETFQLRELVKLNGLIQAQELSNYLKKVSFLVIPSRIESIPVVFSDAMQIGTPVISMPVGDLPHLINRFQCGVAAKEINSATLALAISKAVKTEKNAFGQKTATVFEDFKISHIVRRWLNEV